MALIINNLPEDAIATAAKHIHDILNIAIQYTERESAIVVSDAQCPLAIALTEAYRRCIPSATFINFDSANPDEILDRFKTLAPNDLVVLIQSTNFRLKDFRVRVELFQQSIKVIEHPHLARMQETEQLYYIDSLAYDSNYYRVVGPALKNQIDHAKQTIIDCGGERLIFDSPLEPAKLNIGDYTNMTNIGGQFPIGEVFTEAQNLESVNGRVRLFAFADTTYSVNKVDEPIILVIENGRVKEAINSTQEFDLVLANIRADEDEVWLRELGFGMNKAFTQTRTILDVGTYERMCGIHLSLGKKHTVYKKSNFKRGTTWHHVDVFVMTESVYLDDVEVFKNGEWIV